MSGDGNGNPSALLRKLNDMQRRLVEVDEQLSDQAVFNNPQRLVALNKEKGQLEPVVAEYRRVSAGRIGGGGIERDG